MPLTEHANEGHGEVQRGNAVVNILSDGTWGRDKPLMIHQTSTLTNGFTLHSLEIEIIRRKNILQYRSGAPLTSSACICLYQENYNLST